MTRVLLVAFAGALGTLLRYFVGLWAGRTLGLTFPFGTLIVNVTGCFLIALIAQLAASTTLISPTLRVTLMTGFVGGLTTYSAFNFETTNLLRVDRTWMTGVVNVCATLVLCFLSGMMGSFVARRLTQ